MFEKAMTAIAYALMSVVAYLLYVGEIQAALQALFGFVILVYFIVPGSDAQCDWCRGLKKRNMRIKRYLEKRPDRARTTTRPNGS